MTGLFAARASVPCPVGAIGDRAEIVMPEHIVTQQVPLTRRTRSQPEGIVSSWRPPAAG
jgi:hypothetical protein